LDLKANCQVTDKEIEDNLENGEEYAGIIETPYWNLMLDKWILRIKKKTCKAQIISTIRGGKVWSMDWWFLEKAQL